MDIWKEYLISFFVRLGDFLKNPIIVLYFISIVLIVGSFGVWYPYFETTDHPTNFFIAEGTLKNLATYVIALLAATMADFLLSKVERSKGLKIFAFSIFLLALIAAVLALTKHLPLFGYLGLSLTYLLWIVVFADDETKGLESGGNGKTASGGEEPDKQELPGSLTNFKV